MARVYPHIYPVVADARNIIVHRVIHIAIRNNRTCASCSGDHSFPGEVGDAIRDKDFGRGVIQGDGIFAAVVDGVPGMMDIDRVELATNRIPYVYSAAVPVADLDILGPAVGA